RIAIARCVYIANRCRDDILAGLVDHAPLGWTSVHQSSLRGGTMNIVARHLFLALAIVLSLFVVPAGANAATAGGTGSAAVTSVAPADGAVVGIAHPVTVRFSDPVTDRARAENTLSVTADRPLPGTYSWHGDRELTWTPSGFLP